MRLLRCLGLAFLAAAAFAATAPAAHAQSGRTIKIVVPYPPGSGPDITSRLMAEQISRTQNVSMVVENRPGGGTLIGTEAVMRAAPDGNTVLLVANSFVVNPALKPQPYDVTGSFDPVCQLATTPMILVVQGSSPYRTLDDLVKAARAKPGDLSYGASPASSLHVAGEVIKRAAKIDMTFVPFTGSGPVINSLLGGHITSAMADYPTLVPHLKSGTLRGLVTASPKRVADLPDIPTLIETKLSNYEAEIFYGMVVPAKTPPQMTAQLVDWFTAAMNAPEVKPRLGAQGLFSNIVCGKAFGDQMRKQVDEYTTIAREAKIKME
jgi:tripartite-type tricarboxylate transporter receptor subunit TctC